MLWLVGTSRVRKLRYVSRLAQPNVSNILRVQTHSNPLTAKTYLLFYNLQRKPTLKGIHGWITAPPKEGCTHPLSDDYYIKSICPSGEHGRGQRPALQNRAAAQKKRHVGRTVRRFPGRVGL